MTTTSTVKEIQPRIAPVIPIRNNCTVFNPSIAVGLRAVILQAEAENCEWIQRLHTYVSSHTRRVMHRVSDALRIAAMSLGRSQSALGAFHRRMKARLGAAEAVTATAHKLARLVYRLLKYGEAYVQQGIEDYEKQFQERKLHGLKKAAAAMGFQLVEVQPVAAPVS